MTWILFTFLILSNFIMQFSRNLIDFWLRSQVGLIYEFRWQMGMRLFIFLRYGSGTLKASLQCSWSSNWVSPLYDVPLMCYAISSPHGDYLKNSTPAWSCPKWNSLIPTTKVVSSTEFPTIPTKSIPNYHGSPTYS